MAGALWGDPTWYKAELDDSIRTVRGLEYEFTADADDGSIPNKTTIAVSGALVDVAVVYDGDDPPDTLTVQILDKNGAEVFPETTFSASGYANTGETRWFVPGELTLVCTGNTTFSAKAKVILVIV